MGKRVPELISRLLSAVGSPAVRLLAAPLQPCGQHGESGRGHGRRGTKCPPPPGWGSGAVTARGGLGVRMEMRFVRDSLQGRLSLRVLGCLVAPRGGGVLCVQSCSLKRNSFSLKRNISFLLQ